MTNCQAFSSKKRVFVHFFYDAPFPKKENDLVINTVQDLQF